MYSIFHHYDSVTFKECIFFSCSSTLQCWWPQSSRSKSQLQPHIAATTLGWNYCTIWSGGPEFCSSYSQAYSVVGSVDWGITCTWFHAFHTRISLTTNFYIMLRVLSTCIEWKLPLNLQHNILSTVLKKKTFCILRFFNNDPLQPNKINIHERTDWSLKIYYSWDYDSVRNKGPWHNYSIYISLYIVTSDGLGPNGTRTSQWLRVNL